MSLQHAYTCTCMIVPPAHPLPCGCHPHPVPLTVLYTVKREKLYMSVSVCEQGKFSPPCTRTTCIQKAPSPRFPELTPPFQLPSYLVKQSTMAIPWQTFGVCWLDPVRERSPHRQQTTQAVVVPWPLRNQAVEMSAGGRKRGGGRGKKGRENSQGGDCNQCTLAVYMLPLTTEYQHI